MTVQDQDQSSDCTTARLLSMEDGSIPWAHLDANSAGGLGFVKEQLLARPQATRDSNGPFACPTGWSIRTGRKFLVHTEVFQHVSPRGSISGWQLLMLLATISHRDMLMLQRPRGRQAIKEKDTVASACRRWVAVQCGNSRRSAGVHLRLC